MSMGNNPPIQGRENFLKVNLVRVQANRDCCRLPVFLQLYAHQAHVLDLMKHEITHFGAPLSLSLCRQPMVF